MSSAAALRGLAVLAVLGGLLISTSTRAADKIILGAVGAPTAPYWPFFVGMEKGFFTAEGLEIDIVYAQSSAGIMQQLAAGSVDATIGGGLVDPIRAIEKGAPLAVARILVQAPPYTLVSKPSIKSIGDLRGKTISIGGAKDITRIYLERMVAPSGLKDGDYDLVFAGATGARYSALQAGAVDATLLTAPFNFYAKAAGFTELGAAVDYLRDLPFIGLVVNRHWASTHGPALTRFLAATGRAIAWFQDRRNRDDAVRIMTAVGRLKQDEVEKAYDYFRDGQYFDTSGAVSRSKLSRLLDALRQLGDVPEQLKVDQLLIPGLTQVVD